MGTPTTPLNGDPLRQQRPVVEDADDVAENPGRVPVHRPVARPKIGEVYSPYRRFLGSVIPDPIMQCRVLSPGAKLCFARLARFAGKKSDCYPSEARLASELGVSASQAKRYIAELRREGLVRVERRDRRTTNRYYFVWHPIFDNPTDGSLPILRDGSDVDRKESHVSESLDNDSLPLRAGLSGGAHPTPKCDPEGSAPVKRTIADLMGREPDDEIVSRTLAAAGDGVTAREVCEFLKGLCQRRKPYDPRSKGPRGMGWFPAVVKQHFDQRRAMEGAASDPTIPRHWSQYQTEIDPKFAEALEALELPDAPKNITPLGLDFHRR